MENFAERITTLEAERNIIQTQIDDYKQELKDIEYETHCADNARSILKLAARKTQEKIEVHLSDLVTNAFNMILNSPYKLDVKFVEKRNKTECEINFERNGFLFRPKFTTGGGVIDIASFALRLAYWKLEKTIPIMLFDEPFKYLSSRLIPKAVELLNLLVEQFEMQFIIITHIGTLADASDSLFEVTNGKVECLKCQ